MRIVKKRTQFIHAECYFHTQWLKHAECDLNTQECDFYTQIVTWTHTLISTRMNVITPHTIVISTHTQVQFWHSLVWLWHARVWLRQTHKTDTHCGTQILPCSTQILIVDNLQVKSLFFLNFRISKLKKFLKNTFILKFYLGFSLITQSQKCRIKILPMLKKVFKIKLKITNRVPF
jgi:hypothetical protein